MRTKQLPDSRPPLKAKAPEIPSGFIEGRREDWVPLPREPWKPAAYDNADIGAFKALWRGEADANQQQRAMRWLLYATGVHSTSYDPDSDRNTAFAEGKRWIGMQIGKLLSLRAQANPQMDEQQ
jgi:hypothetical protein